MEELFPIIFEDTDLLVINKPAGLVCHPTKGDAYSSLISRVRLHLGAAIPPHLINRLDRETSGIVVVAKSDETARELRRKWETGAVRKEYFAIIHGHPEWTTRLADLPLGKDEASQVAIKDTVRADGAASQTEFRVLARFHVLGKAYSLIHAKPLSGRKHQIRIHLAHLGFPLLGDKLYGGREDLYLKFVQHSLTEDDWEWLVLRNHALHARKLTIEGDDQVREFVAEPGEEFLRFLPPQLRKKVMASAG